MGYKTSQHPGGHSYSVYTRLILSDRQWINQKNIQVRAQQKQQILRYNQMYFFLENDLNE